MRGLIFAIDIAIFIQPSLAGSVFMPSNIQQQIKRDANNKWPRNYEMQKYMIDNQTEAYYEVRYYKNYKVPDKVLKGIISRAKGKWSGNYEMQAYEINNQVEAYLAIN